MENKQFILLAPPGASGSEHAAALASRWQVSHIVGTELWPAAIAEAATVGPGAPSALEASQSLPDVSALKLVQRRLEQPDAMLRGWVLEAFPQTLEQAQGFDDWWSQMGRELPTVVYLKAMAGILMNRLATQPGQTESTPAIRRRIEQYQTAVEPLLTYYQDQNRLKTINANLPFAEVARVIGRLGQEQTPAAPLIQDEAELDTLIYGQPSLVVDCMASWCGSCKQVSPFIDKLAEEYRDRVKVMKIDFDANRQISKRFSLQGIPAVMYFKNGKLLKTITGVKSYAEYDAEIAPLLES